MTTIIYDNNGKIWLTVDGQTEAPKVNTMTVEVPNDKKVIGIDMATNEPILVDKTDTPEYLIQKLTERVVNLETSQSVQDGAIEDIGEVLSEIVEE